METFNIGETVFAILSSGPVGGVTYDIIETKIVGVTSDKSLTPEAKKCETDTCDDCTCITETITYRVVVPNETNIHKTAAFVAKTKCEAEKIVCVKHFEQLKYVERTKARVLSYADRYFLNHCCVSNADSSCTASC